MFTFIASLFIFIRVSFLLLLLFTRYLLELKIVFVLLLFFICLLVIPTFNCYIFVFIMDSISSKWRKPKARRRSKKSLAGAENIRKRWAKKADELPVNSMEDLPTSNKSDNEAITIADQMSTDSNNLPSINNIGGTNYTVQPSYTLINNDMWSSLLAEVPCSECGEKTLTVITHYNYGLSAKIELICKSCSHKYGSTFSSPREAGNRKFSVNSQITSAFLSMGRGYAALEVFAMMMGIPCMDSKTFTKCLDSLASHNIHAKAEILKMSRDIVKKKYQEERPESIHGNIYDICVSYDGTWQKRGHASLFGIGIVIDILTGLVVDFEIVSKYCQACIVAEKDLGSSSPEFHVWHSSHATECQKNYNGSSNSMEMHAACILWSRSIALGNMRYTTMLCDGDAKAFQQLNEMKVYGDIKILKEECINHVAKRLGTGLRNKVQEWRNKGLTLGGRKKGSLKEDTIKRLQNYYRNAIKHNAPDVPKMKSAIFASLFHCMSTDKKPMHSKCPVGESSWCFFQRALSKNETPRSHSMMKTVLSEAVVEKIMPVYQRLASDDILIKCVSAKTQNANECLHSMIWSKCPKEVFVSKKRLELSVLSAVQDFNVGCETALETLGNIDSNEFAMAIAAKKDKRRFSQKTKRQDSAYKAVKYRKKMKVAAKNAKCVKREGVTYGHGAF